MGDGREQDERYTAEALRAWAGNLGPLGTYAHAALIVALPLAWVATELRRIATAAEGIEYNTREAP